MAQPYIGEIRMFGGNFAPVGWAFCSGQIMAISENDVLFQLLGTTYGGDGQTTFALPNLQSRVPIHFGNGYQLAETGGVESVTLTVSQIPAHSHAFAASSSSGNQINPGGNVVAASFNVTPYINDVTTGTMAASAIQLAGGNQPHDNFQPYLCVNFIISLFGIFPSPT